METYTITKTEPLAIYGGGQVGLGITRRLLEAEYNVVCILDRNPTGVSGSPVPVLLPENGHKTFGEIFVFIALGQGNNHLSVAKVLSDIGFMRCLFLPLFLNTSAAKAMHWSWYAFFEREYNVAIPTYDELWKVSSNDYLLGSGFDFVNTIIHKDYVRSSGRPWPLDNIYSSFVMPRGRCWQSDQKWMQEDRSGIQIDCQANVDIMMKGGTYTEEKQLLLESILYFNPAELYRDFACPACFNWEKGYFNLLDGHHRSFFLVQNNFFGIPLRVKKTDWEAYFRESQAQAMMDYCRSHDTFPFEVKHPAFIRFPVKERETDYEFLRLHQDLCYGEYT